MHVPDGTVSIEEAASACGVSDETIRRRIRTGQLPGAHQTGSAQRWRIPVSDLVAAGFDVRLGEDRGGQWHRPVEVEAARLEALAAERLERIQVLERYIDQLQGMLETLRQLVDGEAAR